MSGFISGHTRGLFGNIIVMAIHRDITGQKFGRLTAVDCVGFHGAFPLWRFLCDCGKEHVTRLHSVLNGLCKSCGCLHAEVMKQRRDDLAGKTFNRLTAIRYVGKDSKRQALWEFSCRCGKSYVGIGTDVKRGLIKSCGCQKDEAIIATGKANTIHGISKTITATSWTAMMQRCYNSKTKAYEAYGAVGIKPCEFIRSTPVNLILAIGERPSVEYSLDRINNDFGYCCGKCAECMTNGLPSNLKWSTRKQQNNNRKCCKKMEINGQTKTLSEWSDELNVPITTMRYRHWKKGKENENTTN